MKKLLFSFLMLISVEAFACSCNISSLIKKYQVSDFIATAKILRLEEDRADKNYHNIEIQLIDVYKGASIAKLKVISSLQTSCGFLPDENTTWLIFASKDNKGFLSFDYCSGSEQIDQQFDPVEYPDLDKKHKKSIDLKLETLRFLKKNKIAEIDKFSLARKGSSICYDNLKGFKERRQFAVYEISVNQDLSIEKIKTLKKFSNRELSGKLTSCIRDNLQFDTKKVKTISEKTKLIMVFFYYQAEEKEPSFISGWDL